MYHPAVTISPGPPISPHILENIANQHYDGIIFTSARSAHFYFTQQPTPPPTDLPAFSVGPKTTQALDSCWVGPIHEASTHRAIALAKTINEVFRSPSALLFPCSNLAHKTLEEELGKFGHTTTRLELYITEPSPPVDEPIELEPGTWIVLSSPSAAQGLTNITGSLNQIRIACIGPTTAEAAVKLGLSVEVISKQPSARGLCQAITEACRG